MNGEILYVDSPDKYSKVCAAIRRSADQGQPIGLDTEFYGVEVGRQSTVARSKLHLISVAVKRFPLEVTPRGFHRADAAVIFCPAGIEAEFAGLLRSAEIGKCVHNLPVDAHTLQNEGIELNAGINTLATARWAWPARARHTGSGGYTLDALAQELVGAGKTESFKELLTETRVEYRSTFRKVRRCECGIEGCRRRSTTSGHSRIDGVEETRRPKEVEFLLPLESITPGHPRWDRMLRYSAADAVLALAVWDLAQREMERVIDVPWI